MIKIDGGNNADKTYRLQTLLVAMANNSHNASNLRVKVAIVVAASFFIAQQLTGSGTLCLAADFRHAKKIIVPASAIPRRYDYNSGTEAVPNSGPAYWSDGSPASTYRAGDSSSDTTYGSSDKSNLVPPPPPDSSFTKSSGKTKYGLIPPPPPSIPILSPNGYDGALSSTRGSLSPTGSGIAVPPRGATALRETGLGAGKYQRIIADPTRSAPARTSPPLMRSGASPVDSSAYRSSYLERHILNSEFHKAAAEDSVVSSVTSQADTLVGQGKLSEAQDLLENYNKLYPHSTSISNKLSQVSVDRAKYYLKESDFSESAKQARLALSYDAHNSEAKNVLDQVLRLHGIDCKDANSRVKIGDLLFSQSKLREARVEYYAALKMPTAAANGKASSAWIERTLAQAHVGLGNVAFHESKLKEAKIEYQNALDKDPDSAVALRQRGLINYKQKDLVAANQDLSRALVLDQQDKIASQTLIELWQRQVSANPKEDANAHMGLARAYQLSNDLKSAQSEYRTVVSIDPNHPNLPAARESFKLALARQEANGDYEAAKTLETHGALNDAYQKAGEAAGLCPSDVKFKLYQAELAERLGQNADAKQHYLEVLRQDPKNVLAAQRIKSLSEAMALSQEAQSLRGPIAESVSKSTPAQKGRWSNSIRSASDPGVHSRSSAPRANDVVENSWATLGSLFVPGVSNAAQSAAPRSPLASNTGPKGEGPALPTLPPPGGFKVPSSDHVNNMSGFLVNLRDYLIIQEKQLNDASEKRSVMRDKVLEAVGMKFPSSSASDPLGKLPPLDSSAPLPPLDLPKNMITSSDVSKLLADIKAKHGIGTSKAGATGKTRGHIPDLISGSSSRSSSAGDSALSSLSPPVAPPIAPSAIPIEEPPSPTLPPPDSSLVFGADNLDLADRRSSDITKLAEPPLMPAAGTGAIGNLKGPAENARMRFNAAPLNDAPQYPLNLSRGSPRAGADLISGASRGDRASGTDLIRSTPAGSLTPQALIATAQSMGLSNQDIATLASQAMKSNPDLVSKRLSNFKQEDIDNAYRLLKQHVALKQQLKGNSLTKRTTASSAQSGTGKAAHFQSEHPQVGHWQPKTAENARAAQAVRLRTPDAVTPHTAPPRSPASSQATNPAGNTAMSLRDRLALLEARNKALLSQLESNQKQLQELRQSLTPTPQALPGGSAPPARRHSSTPSLNPNPGPGDSELQSKFPAPNSGPSVVSHSQSLDNRSSNVLARNPQWRGIQGSALSAAEAAAQAATAFDIAGGTSGNLSLELAGVSVHPTGVRLNVLMRNPTGQDVPLPASTRAVVRMPGLSDQYAKVKFPVKKLAAGSEARGYIGVSGHKIDPSADVFIPSLLNAPDGPKDVHLTVPISSLIGQSH